MVLGLCRLLLRDHHEAEDAAQQTFVSAYRSMLRGSEPRDAAPWLAAIARNECRARIRQRMRNPITIEGELEELLADPADDLADEADRRAELAALTAAIAELPARQREAVALRDFLGLSYEEVATTLSVSVPVVESLLFRARRRLRDSVRTVPRYAASLVALPLAIRGAFSRDLPDLDSAGAAGIAGVAGAAVAGVVAKAISLPFAAKAATAVTVVVAATVGPQLPGAFDKTGQAQLGAAPDTVALTSDSTSADAPATTSTPAVAVSHSKPKAGPKPVDDAPSSSSTLVDSNDGKGDAGDDATPGGDDSRPGNDQPQDGGQDDDGRTLVESSDAPTQTPPPPPAAESTTTPAGGDASGDLPVIGPETDEPPVVIGPEESPAGPATSDGSLPVIGG